MQQKLDEMKANATPDELEEIEYMEDKMEEWESMSREERKARK